MNLTLSISVVDLGDDMKVAVTRLGGVIVRGRPAATAKLAVKNLLWRLGGQDNDETAEIGLSLLMSGKSLDAVAALSDGGN